MSMMATTPYMMVLIKAETSEKEVPGYVFLFSGQKQKYICFHASVRVRFFFDDAVKLFDLQCFTLHLNYQEHFIAVLVCENAVLHHVVLHLLWIFCIFV